MRIKEIDGLRALAVLAVMGFHYLPQRFIGGYIGVDLFFVISGFVITSALQRELVANGTISLRNFYARRFFRIVPPLGVMIGGVLLVTGWRFAGQAALALLSIMNWYRVFSNDTGAVFGHTWSLSIEEQFYLIWPLALLILHSRHHPRTIIYASIVTMMV